MPRGFAPPNAPQVGCTRLAAVRLIAKCAGMYTTSAFSSTSCCSCCTSCCCCRGVHTATPCDSKSPMRYTRPGCPRLNWHRGASAAAVLASLRRDTTLPACSYAFTIGKSRRWWYSSPSCCAGSGRRLIPTGLFLCFALDDAGLHLNQLAHREQSPAPISSPMKLHRSLLFASSRVFVSPVQAALLPGSPRTNGFHVLIIGPTG